MRALMAEYGFIAVALIGIAGVGILLSRTWRWRVGALSLQYFGVFWLVALSWFGFDQTGGWVDGGGDFRGIPH